MFNNSYDNGCNADWLLFKKGDKAALDTIFRTYVKSMIQYGIKFNPDIEHIRDCIQDVFVTLWKNRESISNTTEPKFYLFRALRNRLSKEFSRHSYVSETELYLYHLSAESEPVELTIVTREEEIRTQLSLKHQICKLPARQQEVIYLRFYQNISCEAIAGIMNINYQSVLNLTQKALATLRKGYGREI